MQLSFKRSAMFEISQKITIKHRIALDIPFFLFSSNLVYSWCMKVRTFSLSINLVNLSSAGCCILLYVLILEFDSEPNSVGHTTNN
jgi:hypothetical protein